jgi:4-hydroxy-tetrahydrodipicolinate reductase
MATTSYFADMYDNIEQALKCRLNVITAGEEAAYPWTKSHALAKQIDELAKINNATLLGTGTLPAFMANYLPLAITGLMNRVDKITINRVIDGSVASASIWEHYGFGKKIDETLKEKMDGGHLGNVTWREQIEMTAKSLGWTLDNYTESTSAVSSKSHRTAKSGVVKPGTSCGLLQKASATFHNAKSIDINYAVLVNPNPEEDGLTPGHTISIKGDQQIEASISCPDVMKATAAIMINSIPHVINARPGIITADELPPSVCLQ